MIIFKNTLFCFLYANAKKIVGIVRCNIGLLLQIYLKPQFFYKIIDIRGKCRHDFIQDYMVAANMAELR